MRKSAFFLLALLAALFSNAQKKLLDHTVYDGWQRIGERMISNDGKWVVYTIDPQEGDNELVIQSSDAKYKKSIARGYNAVITEDARFVIFKIKPLFKDSREAKIKKMKPEDTPKDSLAIVELGKDSVWKLAKVKTYKTPDKEAGWVAYHLEKTVEKKEPVKKTDSPEKMRADSLSKVIDSLTQVIQSIPQKKKKNRDEDESTIESTRYEVRSTDAEGDETSGPGADAGTDLVVRNLTNGQEKIFTNVVEYYFSKKGGKLLVEQAKNPKDSLSKPSVSLIDLASGKTTVLSRGGNEFKNFAFSEEGGQVAFVAERDAKPKDLQKFYKVWYFKAGMDSAVLLADKNTVGMKLGMTISEFGNLSFSKSGKRLFFGTAPIQPPKDTSLVDMDLARLDIWHYKDDYLQTQQLYNLQRLLQTNYLAVYHLDKNELKQLGSEEIPTIYPTNEGDGDQFVGVTDYGKRVESQWTGRTKKDIYAINVNEGSMKLVKKDLQGIIAPSFISPTGKYIMWYDTKARHYFAWDGISTRNISQKIKYPLWNEEEDTPDDPGPYGVMGWLEGDSVVFVYDRYDIWKIGLSANTLPVDISKTGRVLKTNYRYIRTDPEELYLRNGQEIFLRYFNETTKAAGIRPLSIGANRPVMYTQVSGDFSLSALVKAKRAPGFIYITETYRSSPNLFYDNGEFAIRGIDASMNRVETSVKLSDINPQQKDYNWGTAELYKWKAFTGKMAEGVLYKPENFDPTKKYPLILYFYETHSNTLHSYIPPTPTGSRLNISFFVSRGYVVFSPDIHYTVGHPAKDCYNHVVSAAQDLAKQKWIDAKNIGIQGQSWGGIQVAQLVTMTNMFKAAWAGAPVANMTSAYGGIRWESGLNRQFQYEKTQSRIGATLWEKPNLYIENSPLFHLPKVTTPLVIMANDADGAVPWYQGIELFTAMRRLGKQVWMLNYNGEAHNLRERRNQKDISIREQQYFDWLLKGEKPPKWITEGVPAVKKGKDWGLELAN